MCPERGASREGPSVGCTTELGTVREGDAAAPPSPGAGSPGARPGTRTLHPPCDGLSPPASACVRASIVPSSFCRCRPALGCCSSVHLSIRPRAVSRADVRLPPTPFLLLTMPWEPEKRSRASSSFCLWFCVGFLNNSYNNNNNNNNNSNNKNNRPSPQQFQVSPK